MHRIGVVRGLMPRLTQAEFALSFNKFKPIFITGESGGEVLSYCKKNGLENRNLRLKNIYYLDPVSMIFGGRSSQSWVFLDKFKEVCGDLDVLETYELYHFFSGQAAEVARDLKLPLICEVWTSFPNHLAYKCPPYSWNVNKVVQNTSLFIARSKRAYDSMLKLAIPKSKIVTLYHGVDVGRFYPGFRKNMGKKNRFMNFLFVGTLDSRKGIDVLLDIWEGIVDKNPNVRLILVGEGVLKSRALLTKGVEVMGRMPHDKLPEIYNGADVFISPSKNTYLGPFFWWEEFFTHTLIEAQACGLPIITTNCGGIPEAVGEGNWIVPQDDPEGLRKAIDEVIENRSILKKVGEKNRKRAEELFDLNRQTDLLEKEIVKIL